MTKYKPLTDYLRNLDGESFMTNFPAIESILGFELPESARQYHAWWANQDRGQSRSWLSAGWKTMDVSPELGTVTFVREGSGSEAVWKDFSKALSIQQAKIGLAIAFGVEPEQVEITIRA